VSIFITNQPDYVAGGLTRDSELLVQAQGRLAYMGHGQAHYIYFHEATPDLLWPKKKMKMKKKATPQPPAP
jgi:hypothetical protein